MPENKLIIIAFLYFFIILVGLSVAFLSNRSKERSEPNRSKERSEPDRSKERSEPDRSKERSEPDRSKERSELDRVRTRFRCLNEELRRRAPADFDARTMLDLPMLYINLDRSKDRREHVEKTFQECGVPTPIRISAVDGNAFVSGHEVDWLTPELASMLRASMSAPSDLLETVTAGEIGCTLSHIKALRFAYDQGWSEFVIFEDDICLSLMPFWPDSLSDLTRRVPSQWNFVVLSPFFCKKRCAHDLCVFEIDNCYSTAAVLGSGRVASAVASFFNSDGLLTENILCPHASKFIADIFLWRRFSGTNYIERLPRFVPMTSELDSTIVTNPNIDNVAPLNEYIDAMERHLSEISSKRYLDQKMI